MAHWLEHWLIFRRAQVQFPHCSSQLSVTEVPEDLAPLHRGENTNVHKNKQTERGSERAREWVTVTTGTLVQCCHYQEQWQFPPQTGLLRHTVGTALGVPPEDTTEPCFILYSLASWLIK